MHKPAIRLSELLEQLGLDDFDVGALGDFEVPRVSARSHGHEAETEVRPHQLAAMGIPQETIRLLENPHLMRETVAMASARNLLEPGAQPWGVIAGAMGSGKSVAAGWWLAHARCTRGDGMAYVASEDVAIIAPGGWNAEERLSRLMSAKALVLDDVGVRDNGHDGRLHPTLQRVLSRRYEHRLKTLCTMNLDDEQWEAYLGEPRLVDRWREIGVYHVTPDGSMRRRRQ